MVDFNAIEPHPVDLDFEPDTPAASTGYVQPYTNYRAWDGEKFPTGFGATNVFQTDYWQLRERSAQLFTENLYARGLIRRLVTNIITTGLSLEAMPDERILGIPADSLNDWQDLVESRHNIWSINPQACDFYGRSTYAEIQKEIYREALIEGDVLIVLHIDPVTGYPKIQVIKGSHVATPVGNTNENVEYGVEIDESGRHVAFHVTQDDGSSVRVPAFGALSGRRVAWLFYGTDRRIGDVRGQPALSLLLQSLKELDRYRDAAIRKAVVNSVIAMFIKKDEEKMGTLPVTGGAVRRGVAVDSSTQASSPRRFRIEEYVPGAVMEELQVGETPVPHSTAGTDVNFAAFESAMLAAFAWANEIPPEILILAFTNNYSASQAAINEFKIYQNTERGRVGDGVCQPIHVEHFTSEVMQGKISAPGFLESRTDPRKFDIFGAWVAGDWSGAIKPATDTLKQANGYSKMVREAWTTNERTSREITGTKFRRNVQKLKRENELKAEAFKPLVDLQSQLSGLEQTIQGATE